MKKEHMLEIIKGSFMHFLYEEDIEVGHIHVLLHFPTLGIALVELLDHKRHILDTEDVEDMDELILQKELNSKPIYVDFNSPDLHVGHLINDILMEGQFVPLSDAAEENLQN